jgi:hypothetical protein
MQGFITEKRKANRKGGFETKYLNDNLRADAKYSILSFKNCL